MSTALYVAAFWLVLSVLLGLWVGLVIRARDERERPSGPRVRVEHRTVRPWVQR